MAEFLYPHQKDAVERMKNGCILNGGVGSGKSRTGLYYYFKEQGGWIDNGTYHKMSNPRDLYIITTPKKRDTHEWEIELSYYSMSSDQKFNLYSNQIIVDSWNNIKKYQNIYGAFFIFDEDKVTGKGAWVKSFYKIARKNQWIILSATPGDTWEQYIPVFIANGFYKNKTEFNSEHCVFSRFTKYPKIERYICTAKLERLRNSILIDMEFRRNVQKHEETIICDFDILEYRKAVRTRWDPFKNEPMQQVSSLCYVLRRIVNSDVSRKLALLDICSKYDKVIIFYNFDYEREILLNLDYGKGYKVAEWTGHAHEPLPQTKKWIYLVNYASGAEGWNCIDTNVIVFYSQNYSYKTIAQAKGRIDRMNSQFTDLYYYTLSSKSSIDLAINMAIKQKRIFNERTWKS